MLPFTVLCEFLKEFELTSPNVPELFVAQTDDKTTATTDISVDVAHVEKEIYQVGLTVKATPKMGDKTIFSLKCVYCELVSLSLPDNAEEEKRYILTKVVPRMLYPMVRDLVTHMVIRAGFPPLPLQAEFLHEGFELSEKCKSDTCDDGESDEIAEISYDSVVDSFSESKEGAGFVESCKKEGLAPQQQYDDTPMAKLFYRFIAPLEYKHPAFENIEVDESFWSVFLKMLMSDTRYSTRFETDENNEIDIYVSCADYDDTKLTELDENQFDILVKMLVVGSWTNRTMALLRSGYNENDEANKFNAELPDGVLPTREKYCALIEQYCKSESLDTALAEGWYDQLDEINSHIAVLN